MKSKIIKILKIALITLIVIFGLLFTLPIVFEKEITQKVKEVANDNLEGKLDFKDTNLSFFKHFPSLTLTLTDFNLNGSKPFQNQSLINSKEIGFGIDVLSVVFGNQIEINKVFLENPNINVQVNENGEANYNVYKSTEKATKEEKSNSSIQIRNIDITNAKLLYNDVSSKIKIDCKGFNYKGKGELVNDDFRLITAMQIADFSFAFDQNEYLKNKKVKADLITKINTNSLSLIFEKNDLVINKLLVDFSGFFNFLKNGYKMDFNLKTQNSNLQDLFTALPPEYIKWMKGTKMSGNTDALFRLNGKYIAATNENPSVVFKIKLRNGLVQNINAPFPAKNIYLNLETKLPNLDINQLQINLDSLYFNLGKNKLSAILKSEGFKDKFNIDTKIKSDIDLGILSKTIQVPNYSIAGKLDADIVSKGIFDATAKKFPITTGKFNLQNGLIKTPYYPKPIEKINVVALLNCPTNDYNSATLSLQPASFEFENEPFSLKGNFKNMTDLEYDVQAKGTLNLAPIYKVFSQKGLDINGIIKADLAVAGKQSDATSGKINKLKNSGTLELINIQTKSEYLPKPFLIERGLFTFNQDKMNFTNFKGKYGSSDVEMNGYVLNAINFYLNDKAVLKGNLSFKSNFLNINELMPQNEVATSTTTTDTNANSQSATATSGVIEIPTNLDLMLTTQAKKVKYDDLTIDNLGGNIQLKNGKISLANGTLGIIGATAKMNGAYQNNGTQKADFNMDIKASDFDVKRAYNEIKLFKEIVTAAENAEGIIGLDYAIKGTLNNKMEPIMPSLAGKGTLSVKQVKMKGFKLLNVVSQKTNNDKINNPDISKVDIKSSIKNNILNIERFKFKVSGFRLRFEGQTSLDGKLNLKMRIGLPPLGIIGIPIKVSGTQDNPKIKLGKNQDDLEETEYDGGE